MTSKTAAIEPTAAAISLAFDGIAHPDSENDLAVLDVRGLPTQGERAIDHLIQMIGSTQPHVLASADASSHLARFAALSGFPLPSDMVAFFTRFESVSLFDRYYLLPVTQWQRTGAALRGPEWLASECPSWYAFCDVLDGDYVGIDLHTMAEGANSILDCDHDDTSERRVIAHSFTEFLTRALGVPDKLFYLDGDFTPLRTLNVPYEPPRAWLQREYQRWSADPEVGPERCKKAGCSHLHIALSVFCRRHHFENIHRLPYPFDD